jgi:hypothetical protein
MIKDRNDAARVLEEVGRQCQVTEAPLYGWVKTVSYNDTDGGREACAPIPHTGKQVTIPPRMYLRLSEIADFLCQDKAISNYFMRDDILRRLCYMLGESQLDLEALNQRFSIFVQGLRAKHPPALSIVPLADLAMGEDPIDLGATVIGKVNPAFERCVLVKCQELGLPSFGFTDDVSWCENYLMWRNNPELRDEIDLTWSPVIMAIWTAEQGHLASGPSLKKIETWVASLCFIATVEGISDFAVPRIHSSGTNFVETEIVDDDVETRELIFLYDGFVGPVSSTYHIWPGHRRPLDLTQLLAKPESLDLAKRLMKTTDQDGKIADWEARFARYVQWWHVGTQSAIPSTAIIAFVFALEALLGPQRASDQITRIIAERVAYLESGISVERRLEVNRAVRGFYDQRSRLAHGQATAFGYNDDIMSTSRDLQEMVLNTGKNFLSVALAAGWKTYMDMEMWFDRCRFSLPSS